MAIDSRVTGAEQSEVRRTRIVERSSYVLREDYDPLTKVFELGPNFIGYARLARRGGASHRDVYVGAALLANNVTDRELGVFLGYNNSPVKGRLKFCAEIRARQVSEKVAGVGQGHFERREAIAVVGPADPAVIESINHRVTQTLPPCEPCRSDLDPSMLVLTVDEAADRMQAYTGAQLIDFFAAPISQERRRRRRQPVLPEEAPVIDFSNDPLAFWNRAHEMYAMLEAGIRVDTERELRLSRAEAAVTALYQADRA